MGWISTDSKTLDSDGSRLGFRFGLLADVQLGSNANYFFSTGLFLNNVGAKTKFSLGDSLNTVFKSEVKYQYVELPVTIKLKTNEIGYMTYFGQHRIRCVGVRVAAKSKTEGGDFEDATMVRILRVALAGGRRNGVQLQRQHIRPGRVEIQQRVHEHATTTTLVAQSASLHYFEVTVGALF